MAHFKSHTVWLLLSAVTFMSACGGGSNAPAPVTPTSPSNPTPPTGVSNKPFTDATTASNINHGFGYTDDFMQMPRHFAGGAASGDIDGDGDIDLVIARGNTGPNLVYLNNGSAQFTEAGAAAGLALPDSGLQNYKMSGPTLADIDADGDLDLFVGGLDGDPSLVFQNDGSGVFTNVTAGSGLDVMTSKNTISASFGDYDQDGDLDLVMAHWGTPRDQNAPGDSEILWRNDSDASGIKFTSVSVESNLSAQMPFNLSGGVLGANFDYSFAPSLVDINSDGFPDLLMVTDFQGTRYFENNTDGTFTDRTDRTQINDTNGMGSAVGDYDNDGDPDWFVSSIDSSRLYLNTNGQYSNATNTASVNDGGWGWGSCFADFNLDGHLDIYQTNGWQTDGGNPNEPYNADASRLWMNDGSGVFFDRADEYDVKEFDQGRAVVCADFDNDMDTDILLLTTASTTSARLWLNDNSDQPAVKIHLSGPANNPYGIGSKIEALNGSGTQTRWVGVNSSFTAHNPTDEIFALGNNSAVNITVTWPDGSTTIQNGVGDGESVTISAQ